MMRRLQAICAHKQLDLEQLAARRRLRLCFRVPKLTSGEELQAAAGELYEHPAALVIVDPLYLAVASAATGAHLYAMSAVLAGIQAVCQRAGGGDPLEQDRRGPRCQAHQRRRPGRLGSGAGLCRRRPPRHWPDGTSTVVLSVEVIGGELADLAFRVRRSVRAEDPTDLASPLHYAVEVLPEDPDDLEGGPPPLKPSRRWVLAALRAAGAMQTVAQLGDPTAADGHQLKARPIQEALNDLEAAGLAQDTNPGVELARYWSPTDPTGTPGQGGDGGDP